MLVKINVVLTYLATPCFKAYSFEMTYNNTDISKHPSMKKPRTHPNTINRTALICVTFASIIELVSLLLVMPLELASITVLLSVIFLKAV